MKFKSTRGGVCGASFEESLLSGLAADGGLFLPEDAPVLSKQEWAALAAFSYPQLVAKFLRMFTSTDELSDKEIGEVMDGCYSKFTDPDKVITTTQLGKPLVIAELWHGPTGAFKDLSLSVLGRMVNLFLKKKNKKSTVLVSTSGDTGSAAIQSVLGLDRIQLMVMYPRGMVTAVQELQMVTVDAPNVHVFSVDGTADDTDVVLTTLHNDRAFSKQYNLNCFNSLNVVRILMQAVHFVFLYLQQCPEADQDVVFCIPTGGMGNISSGLLARSMGLPVKFLAAVNDNDTIHRAFESGVYSPSKVVLRTFSCAMDIGHAYNIERVVFYLAKGDTTIVKQVMEEFNETKSFKFPTSVSEEARSCVWTASVSQEGVLSTMREVWEKHNYLLCPHTAVAVRAALDRQRADQKCVIISTATPAKFKEAVKEAGLAVPSCPKFEALDKCPQKKKYMEKGEDWPAIMKQAIAQAWTKE